MDLHLSLLKDDDDSLEQKLKIKTKANRALTKALQALNRRCYGAFVVDDDDLIARKIKIKIKRSRCWQRPRPATVEYYVTCVIGHRPN